MDANANANIGKDKQTAIQKRLNLLKLLPAYTSILTSLSLTLYEDSKLESERDNTAGEINDEQLTLLKTGDRKTLFSCVIQILEKRLTDITNGKIARENEDAAVVRLQALARGRGERKRKVDYHLRNLEEIKGLEVMVNAKKEKEEKEKEEKHKQKAATKIQALRRSKVARANVSDKKVRLANNNAKDSKNKETAAVKLQSLQRSKTAKITVNKRKATHILNSKAAVKLQSASRKKQASSKLSSLKRDAANSEILRLKRLEDLRLSTACISIQRVVRGGCDRVKVRQIKRALAFAPLSSSSSLSSPSTSSSSYKSSHKQKSEYQTTESLRSTISIGDIVKCKLAGERLAFEGCVIGVTPVYAQLQLNVRGSRKSMNIGVGVGKSRRGSRDSLEVDSVLAIANESNSDDSDDSEEEISENYGAPRSYTYDVDFGNGDVQENIPSSSVYKVQDWSVLEVGDHVMCPLPMEGMDGSKGGLKGEAVVVNVWGDGIFDVKFIEDFSSAPDADEDVTSSIITKIHTSKLTKKASSRTQAVLNWKKGSNAILALSAFRTPSVKGRGSGSGSGKWGGYRKLSTVGSIGGGLGMERIGRGGGGVGSVKVE